jgi:hypothetical protein
MFGVSPERFERERAAAADAQALAFARLSPIEKASFGVQRGAYGLARALGGALGGQDPELQRVTRRQQVAGQIDYTNLASIRQAMEMLPDDPVAVQQLSDIYRQVQESAAKVSSDQALTTQRLREREGADPVQQLLRTGKFTPASVAAYQTSGKISDLKPVDSATKTQVVETAGGQLLVDMGTGQTIANLGAAPDRRSVTKVSVGGTAENEYAKKVGTATATADLNIIDSAQAVAGTLPKMYETFKLLETGDLNTGFAAEFQQVIDRAKTKLLADKKAGKRVTDTEYLDALLGSDVFPQISALGIGARGLDTPAEREFLRQVITGTISLDRETLKRMTDFRIKAAERAVEGYNKKLTAGEFKQYQDVTGRTLSPIAVTPRPVSGQGDGTPGNPIKLR